MVRILVMGDVGFIGSHLALVDRSTKEGSEAIILDSTSKRRVHSASFYGWM
jgi:nucleoside-diphosphate-sugar epimerase